MSANETIIAVPINIESSGQTRQFLVRLIERLDIVLGGRGGDPYVPESLLNSTTAAGLTQLETTILAIITTLFATDSEETLDLTNTILETALAAIEALKSSSTISDSDVSTETISDPPTQIEVQAVADRLTANSTDFNDLLTALRGTEIIAT